MASATVYKNPNFAVICSFLQRYGEHLQLPDLTIPELQESLENVEQVSQELLFMHIKLMRRIIKNVSVDRWQKQLAKMLRHWCNPVYAWEIEEFGYTEIKLDSKINLLKFLCESQFDTNAKVREVVNEESPDKMRLQPIGRDKTGLVYWYQKDQDANIRLYREEQDDDDSSSWQLISYDRNQLAGIIHELKSSDIVEDGESTSSDDKAENGSEKKSDETEDVKMDVGDAEIEGKGIEKKVEMKIGKEKDERIEDATESTKVKEEKDTEKQDIEHNGKEEKMKVNENKSAEISEQTTETKDVGKDTTGGKIEAEVIVQKENISEGKKVAAENVAERESEDKSKEKNESENCKDEKTMARASVIVMTSKESVKNEKSDSIEEKDNKVETKETTQMDEESTEVPKTKEDEELNEEEEEMSGAEKDTNAKVVSKKPKKKKKRRVPIRYTPKRRSSRKAAEKLEEMKEEEEEKEKQPEEEDEEPQEEHDSPCGKCHQYNHPEWILLCDSCDAGYHTACLRPPLMIIPDGDWFCPSCEHVKLISQLEKTLEALDQEIKQKARKRRKKNLLTYVGISEANILPVETLLIEKPKRKKKKRQYKDYVEDFEEEYEVIERRSRRNRKQINYRFDEFDNTINSAIRDEVEEHDKALEEYHKNYGFSRGKDIETIERANREGGDYGGKGPREDEDDEERRNYERVQKKKRKLMDLDAESSEASDGSEDFKLSESEQSSSEKDDLPYDSDESVYSGIGRRSSRRLRQMPTRRSSRTKTKKRARYQDYSDSELSEDELVSLPETEESSYDSDELTGRTRQRKAARKQVSYREDSNSDDSDNSNGSEMESRQSKRKFVLRSEDEDEQEEEDKKEKKRSKKSKKRICDDDDSDFSLGEELDKIEKSHKRQASYQALVEDSTSEEEEFEEEEEDEDEKKENETDEDEVDDENDDNVEKKETKAPEDKENDNNNEGDKDTKGKANDSNKENEEQRNTKKDEDKNKDKEQNTDTKKKVSPSISGNKSSLAINGGNGSNGSREGDDDDLLMEVTDLIDFVTADDAV
ncbi:remodeling and spacing factor 1-like [Anneissia japonica]|uniref:remodeling and spacing factor 1-like n=1 Tax=Anneissia japonica TaxID=1529436 RepID=UPI00142580EE|nr:remodeling and spacing factor 1-like [Anneissia japonica]